MPVRRIVPTILPTLLLIDGLCEGQSLGKAARQIWQQKQKGGRVAKKVIATDDLSIFRQVQSKTHPRFEACLTQKG
jgi:hypothetical protein